MSGIIKAGAGVGILIMPVVASWLISGYGWRTSYVIVGSIALVFMVAAAQFLRRDPGQMQLLPDGETEAAPQSPNLDAGEFSFQRAIYVRQFWMLCVIYFAIMFCAQTILVHIVPHAIDLKISPTTAASVLAVVGGASIVGRFLMGSAGDRIGNKSALVVCFVFFSAAFLWLQVARELWMLYLFAVIYGFAHGGFFALASPIVAELFGLSSHGALLGTVFFSGTIGGAIGPVLSGHIFDITGSYQLAFLVCITLSVIGLILTLLLKPTTNKREKVDIISIP